MKVSRLINVLMVALVLLVACAAPAPKEIVIGMTVPGLQFPFFVIMKDEADAAAAKLGVKIVLWTPRMIRPNRPQLSRALLLRK